ncbi:MAG: alpha-N-acetylglucosaminidase C-terminal domain-containing protein [Clostridia bacterium]|nr:alpha-N-acetylglucosaminidase C-terminal domain-containing protein [Clostridia bacterium]
MKTKKRTMKRSLIVPIIAFALIICVLSAIFAIGSFADEPTLTNVAQGKTVTTPDEVRNNRYVSCLVDGITWNYWETRVEEWFSVQGLEQNGYAIVDLGTAHYIDNIKVYTNNAGKDGAVNYAYQVLASYDGVIWRMVGEKTLDTVNSGSGDKFDFSACPLDTARYVKLVTKTNDSPLNQWNMKSNDGMHMCELQVWGYEDTSYVDPEIGDVTIENLALGKDASAEAIYNSSNPPSKAVDGTKSGFWEGRFGSELVVDLGYPCYIDYIHAFPLVFNDNRGYMYEVWASLDGEKYELVGEKTNYDASTISGDIYYFHPETLKTARYIKVKMNSISIENNNGTHLSELEVYGYKAPSYMLPEGAEITNISLNKPIISVSSGSDTAAKINDGANGDWWEAKSLPATLEIDLGSGCFITSIKAETFYGGDGRYYLYNIYGSVDGSTYEMIAEKSDESVSARGGNTFNFDVPEYARYIKIEVLHNSVNEAGHIKELTVMGCADPDYVEVNVDKYDPENVAYEKPAYSNLSPEFASNVTDGKNGTTWNAEYYPAAVDVDLEEQYDISEINVFFPVSEGRYYYYTVYGSNDYKTFDRLYQKRTKDVADNDGDNIKLTDKTYRYIRVYVEYCSGIGTAALSEVRVHGTPTGNGGGELRGGTFEEIIGMKPFSETEYAAPITEEEIFENIYGIIDRTVGSEYRSWFSFEIAPNAESDKDYYEILDKNGKIHIIGNEGLSITSGINYYYKNYCHVNISEQAYQNKMPSEIVPIGEGTVIRRETPYEVRYAFNYCTLDYTFAFFGEEDYQKENDWLALNGVNCVLDLSGQEAVWIKFLMNFGYSFDEAKNWLAGPAYYAWQFMQNLEITGGPISDQWVVDRLEMARKQQRWKASLGMDTVLQAYTGMVPTNFADYQPDAPLIAQGTWAGLNRPYMLRTDADEYKEYAKLFYEAQNWAFGDISDHYAADPFHEGGIKPTDLGEDVIARNVIESLLEYDAEGVWMVQAWTNNPTVGLLEGVKDYKDEHIMILDLGGLRWYKTAYTDNNNPLKIDDPGTTYLDYDEFNNTNWVYCYLDNYGGTTHMDGYIGMIANFMDQGYTYTNLDGVSETKYLRDAEHLKGIGIIPEATYDNPVKYDLFWELVWTTEKISIYDWLEDYALRRYGSYSESANEAWTILYRTLYTSYGNEGHFVSKPEAVTSPSAKSISPQVQQALALLLTDFDKLSSSEAYMYDLSELMRQVVTHEGSVVLADVYACYNNGDLEGFREYKKQYLALFDLANSVAATQQEMLLGEWIGKAEDWAARDGFDDFSYDQLTLNAKMLVTTWAGYNARQIVDYARRGYNGLYEVYKDRWSAHLDVMEQSLIDGTTLTTYTADQLNSKYFYYYWEWMMNTPEYTRDADNSTENMKKVATAVLFEACPDIDIGAYFLSFDGYQVRMDSYNGLRSRFVVDLTKLEALEANGYTVVEFGSIAASSEKLAALGEELAVTKQDDKYQANSFAVMATVYNEKDGYVGKYTEKDDEGIVYHFTVTNFNSSNYDKEITVRGYAVIRDKDGNEFVIYADYPSENDRSVSLKKISTDMAAGGYITAENCISYKHVLEFDSLK